MHCIVVRRGDFQTYDLLYKTFGARVPVIWDRRRRNEATGNGASETGERRTAAAPASWVALNFVVVDRYS